MTWEIDPDVVEREKERAEEDDRATEQSISAFLSQPGSSESVCAVPDDTDRSPRTRNLRSTFRPTPAESTSDPGFPGTRSFAPHRVDRRAIGATEPSTRTGDDAAPAPVARADNASRRGAALQQTRTGSAAADRAAVAADQGSDRGNVRGRRGSSGAKSAAVGAAAGRRGRPPGSGKTKKQVEAGVLPKAIAKLIPKDAQASSSSTSKITPTESERADARRLFRQIGETFNTNRKLSKTKAYAAYRHDLMANLDTLIMGGAIDLKEATTIITNLEQYTKETEAESTETPATILGRWLRMDATEVAGLEAGIAEESIDANDQLAVEEDELEEAMEEAEVVESVE